RDVRARRTTLPLVRRTDLEDEDHGADRSSHSLLPGLPAPTSPKPSGPGALGRGTGRPVPCRGAPRGGSRFVWPDSSRSVIVSWHIGDHRGPGWTMRGGGTWALRQTARSPRRVLVEGRWGATGVVPQLQTPARRDQP